MIKLDPITAELIRNSLQSIVDEMALTLVRTAYSANLKSAMDLSSAICDQHGRLIAQGLTLPLHLGSIPDAMQALLHRFGGNFRPGDAFVLNDPYEGGTHLPDFFVFQPVFRDDQLIAFAVTVAHHTDVGGRVAGGNGWDSTEIYQEGLRIPVVRLCTDGQINDRLPAPAQRQRAHSDQSAGRSACAAGGMPHWRARAAGAGRHATAATCCKPRSRTC